MKAEFDQAATIIAKARLARERLKPIPALKTLEDGYEVQQLANARLVPKLGPVIGHKIGGTTETMRQSIGAPEPIAGEIFASTVHASGAKLRFADYVRPGIETEIAVRLKQALPPRSELYTRDDVAQAVESVMTAIEIVDDRYESYANGAPTMAADNVFDAGSILGEPIADWRRLDLARQVARTIIDGEVVAEGMSDLLLGHPLTALTWLANRRSALGLGLDAGMFVSLGTITPVQWIERPAHCRIEVGALGAVELQLV